MKTYDEQIRDIKRDKKIATKMANKLVAIMRDAETDLGRPSMPKVWAKMEKKYGKRKVVIIDMLHMAGYDLSDLKKVSK